MVPEERYEEITDPDGTRWSVDVAFLSSRWRCRWGDGCQGIGDEPDAASGLGCCSVGAELLDEDEAMTVAALAATLEPEQFQHHHAATTAGVFRPGGRDHTAVVDGACIFLNRPGFPGGAGCALHLAAVADGDEPRDWKPSVCWQLPLRVEHGHDELGPVSVLRRWRRADWGPGGETMAWCCTEADECHDAEVPVVESLSGDLEALVGRSVMVELRRREHP